MQELAPETAPISSPKIKRDETNETIGDIRRKNSAPINITNDATLT
jgi:hypothetical protein